MMNISKATNFLLLTILCFTIKAKNSQASVLIETKLVVNDEVITGTVRDTQNGSVIPGVSIIVLGTSIGTASDADGRFSLNVPTLQDTLQFSFIGYKTQIVPISNRTSLEILLESSITSLEQLVVSGMATKTKQENLANDITYVSSTQMMGSGTPTTVSGALEGKAPGVEIQKFTGAPGGGFSIKMRGISSLGAGSSEPLYVVDGVFVNNRSLTSGRSVAIGAGSNTGQDQSSNRLSDLSPNDIESIEILKGPAAAAIYGSRANGGVVIITTKGGIAGKTRISVSQDIGFSEPIRILGVSDWPEEQIKAFYPASRVSTELQRRNDAARQGRIYNYSQIIFDNKGPVSTTNIDLTGGNDRTTFFLSGAYHNETGIVKNTGFERGSILANVNHSISDRVKIRSSSNFVNSMTRPGFFGNQNGTGASVTYALAFTPAYAQLHKDANGDYPDNPYFPSNPLQLIEYGVNEQGINRFIQSISFDAELLNKRDMLLSFSMNGGADYLNGNSLIFLPPILQNERSSTNPGDIVRTKEDNFNANIRSALVAINETENFTFTSQIGFSRVHVSESILQSRGRGMTQNIPNIRLAEVQSVVAQGLVREDNFGIFGQEQVNWNDKLIGTLGLRGDRSSLNYKQKKYYLFPQASLAINVSNFDFFNIKNMSQLKLRVAFGQTGGRPKFGDIYQVLNGVNMGGQSGLSLSNRDIDPNLRPETAQELEFGTDIGFFDNRLSLTATYYIKTVMDLILDLPTPSSTGITAIATNAADLRNKGIELGLKADIIQSTSFSWTTNVNYWSNDSEITRLLVPAFTTGGFGPTYGTFLIQKGYSPRTIVGTPALPNSKSLYTVYGHADPDFEMSFNNDIKLPFNFELNFLLYWRYGNYSDNTWLVDIDDGGTREDWHHETLQPGMMNGPYRMTKPQTETSVLNASFFRLNRVALKYTMPYSAVQSIVERVRFGVSAENLFTITPYYGYGVDSNYAGNDAVNYGLSLHPYPSSRLFLFNVLIDI